MNNETVISWTVTNWITVFLMVVGASAIAGAGLKAYNSRRLNRDNGDA